MFLTTFIISLESHKYKSLLMSSTTSISAAATGAAFKFPKKLFLEVSPVTTDWELEKVAEQYGRVHNVHIPKNERNQSRGFAFVTFRWHEDAAAAMEDLEGSPLGGMILHPRWAAPKKTNKKQEKVKPKRNGSRK
jgi:RNA recognition motif-containing protein